MEDFKVADLARPAFKANPYPFYARVRKEKPIYRTTFLGMPTWLLTRYDDVVTVLKDERFLKNWPPRTKWINRLSGPISEHMLNKDAPDHTRLRTLVHKAFTPSLVERLQGRIQAVSDELLDKLQPNGQMDLVSGFSVPLPLTIIAELLGIPAEERRRFYQLARSSLSFSSAIDLLRTFPDQRFIIRRLRKLIAARRREPRDDLITSLVQVQEAGDKLSEAELIGMITLLLVAGYETTVNLIGTGAFELLQRPEHRELLSREPALSDSAIEELLRFTSPLDISSPRFASEDLQLNSVTITRGETVIAILGSANHDESQFNDPDTLDLARNPNRHVAFGQGVHFCIGAPLARLEAQIALTTLFRRFPSLRLARAAADLRWRKSLIVRGLEELPVQI